VIKQFQNVSPAGAMHLPAVFGRNHIIEEGEVFDVDDRYIELLEAQPGLWHPVDAGEYVPPEDYSTHPYAAPIPRDVELAAPDAPDGDAVSESVNSVATTATAPATRRTHPTKKVSK
jgi:hypothetical protein